jgi:hypothetical protein
MARHSLQRALIYQLLKLDESLFSIVAKHYRGFPASDKSWCETPEFEGQAAPKILSEIAGTGRDIVCIVDALDEAAHAETRQEKTDRRCRQSTVLGLCNQWATATPNSRMKFIVLGRPEPAIELDFHRVRKNTRQAFRICLEEQNEEDINRFIDDELEKLRDILHGDVSDDDTSDSDAEPSSSTRQPSKQRALFHGILQPQKPEDRVLQTIRTYIRDHASGVFLWVSLVLEDLQDSALYGLVSPADLEARLMRLPLELDKLYAKILSDIQKRSSPETLDKIRIIYMLVDGASTLGSPLEVRELREAMAVPTTGEWTEDNPLESRRVIIGSWNDFRRQLRRLCGPLFSMSRRPGVAKIGVSTVDASHTVEFIHRTVKDFFESRWQEGGLYFSEEEAVAALRACADHYLRIAFRITGTTCSPGASFEINTWERHIESLVERLETCVWTATCIRMSIASKRPRYVGDDGLIMRTLMGPCMKDWDSESAWSALSEKLAFFPWISPADTGKLMVESAIVGEVTYAICRGGYVEAHCIMTYFWNWASVGTALKWPMRWVVENSALKYAVETGQSFFSLFLTIRNRHVWGWETERIIPSPRVRPFFFHHLSPFQDSSRVRSKLMGLPHGY